MSPSETRGDDRSRTSRAPRVPRALKFIAATLILVLAMGVGVPLVVTATPEFFSRYHLLERRYVNLEDSAHEGIGCRECHQTSAVANGVQLVAEYYTSFVSTATSPQYFRFGPPTNDRCLKCHSQDWSTRTNRTDKIPHPAHLRVASETRPCTGCHKWTAHFEPYIAKHKTMPFSGVCVAYGCHVGTKSTKQCFDCHHVLRPSAETWSAEHPKVVKATGQNPCMESCHKVADCQLCHTTGKKPTVKGLRLEVGMKDIEKLHIKPDWTKRYHGAEALKGRAKCLRCHESDSECGECHRERPAFHGGVDTWIGRHSKATKKVDDPACIECHKKAWCADCHRQFKDMR